MRFKDPKSPKYVELSQGELEAAAALGRYFNSSLGFQAMISRGTGILAPTLSRMAKGQQKITLEHAMRIELASNRELRAEKLCPACSELLALFAQARAGDDKAAA